ncbi:aminopeptidase [Spirochaetia bacterium]|nr:aminopeptidase [Spirochaetia bacterium]
MKIILTDFDAIVPVLLAAALILGASALFSGCYTLQQGVIMLGYLGRAVPLEDLTDRTPDASDLRLDTSPSVNGKERNREFAARVGDIRRFAMEELGLKETKNYTRYVEIDRNYLAAVVSAVERDAFVPYEWWFPVVGKVPYKGFFREEDARREGEKLRRRDLDVWIRGVEAFSTLGWFRDPLYSYMRDYPVHELADLVIHELLHATVYLKGHSQFDEELAEFVGREGSHLYIEKRYGPDSEEYRKMVDSAADGAAFVSFIQELIAELGVLYNRDIPREEKLERKAAIIQAAQGRFTEEYEARFREDTYRDFAELPVNNAYLELFRLYYDESRFFDELYAQSGRDMAAFIAAAKTVTARGKGTPYERLEQALSAGYQEPVTTK